MAKNVLIILMPEQFQDFEFKIPYTTLKNKGYTVDVAGLRPGVAIGKFGMTFTPNLQLAALKETDFDRYDVLVIPGGPGSTTFLWDNELVQNVARYFNSKEKIVAAICYGCMVPAEAGIVHKATIYPSDEAKQRFEKLKVNFIDQHVFSSHKDRVITAQGPKDAEAFTQAIINMLQ